MPVYMHSKKKQRQHPQSTLLTECLARYVLLLPPSRLTHHLMGNLVHRNNSNDVHAARLAFSTDTPTNNHTQSNVQCGPLNITCPLRSLIKLQLTGAFFVRHDRVNTQTTSSRTDFKKVPNCRI